MYGLTVDEFRRVVDLAGGDPAAVDAAIRVVLKQAQPESVGMRGGRAAGRALDPSDMGALLDAFNEDAARGADEWEA